MPVESDYSEYNNYDNYYEDVPVIPYRPSKTIYTDLVHTKLDISFDFKKQHLNGIAWIVAKPHFYSSDSLTLDARGMDIKSVDLVSVKYKKSLDRNFPTDSVITKNLSFTYDNYKIRIKLPKTYSRSENFGIKIVYTAKPNELEKGGNDAIREDKGLYFIDPLDTIPGKPTQIWTQGETESARCWFPTIDATNQKTTEEISITVPSKFITLSNGELQYKTENKDGTRTDYWKQDLPHAPYLFMVAAGEFAEVKDKWRNKEVNYYVEKEYEPYARLVFGNTPEMMEFFSKKMGVDYPWEKFHQVVVRDFVSGAMENTSCVVHFDKLQHDAREHLDETYESIIAHELFHHWFGDLVTAESWANLPLNESFATYGEYLWTENKYGRSEADIALQKYLERYFSEEAEKSVDLIRFHYENPGDMFDGYSYQKGGHVLHMLRKYTGDEAFFKSLNLYLTRNKYKSAEIHDLRLAFEEVTGEDLNWFFNQWFLGEGHPELYVEHTFNAAENLYTISVNQQGLKLFSLPIDVDFHYKTGVKRQRIWVDKDTQIFVIKVTGKPDWVSFDAEKQLLGKIYESKPLADWQLQFTQSKLVKDKLTAMQFIRNSGYPDLILNISIEALNDSSWFVRKEGAEMIVDAELYNDEKVPVNKVINIGLRDPKSAVRASMIPLLLRLRTTESIDAIKSMLYDSAYSVSGTALYALSYVDPELAYSYADKNRYSKTEAMTGPIAYTIAVVSTRNELAFFREKILKSDGNTKYEYLSIVPVYLQKSDDNLVKEGIKMLSEVAAGSKDPIVQFYAKHSLETIAEDYSQKAQDLRASQVGLKKKSDEYKVIETKIISLNDMERLAKQASESIQPDLN
ncbi:MAG: M1 family metallopeptidase [Bacteroidia bacterium]|nr:M1 family metallopeptidase [Bacteroidia bacterium]